MRIANLFLLQLKIHLGQNLRVEERRRKEVPNNVSSDGKSLADMKSKAGKNACVSEEACPTQRNKSMINNSTDEEGYHGEE